MMTNCFEINGKDAFSAGGRSAAGDAPILIEHCNESDGAVSPKPKIMANEKRGLR